MRAALLAVVASLLLLPAGASAQSSPFAPLPTPAPEQPTPVPVDGTDQSDGISSTGAALIIGGGILFVIGVGVAIGLDARRNAPADPRPGSPGAGPGRREDEIEGLPGERKKRDRRQQEKQKATAKRARQARKKNRPVRK